MTEWYNQVKRTPGGVVLRQRKHGMSGLVLLLLLTPAGTMFSAGRQTEAAPSIPQNFHATTVGNYFVDLGWDASTPSAGVTYHACVGRETIFGPDCIRAEVSTSGLTCRIDGLSPGTDYTLLLCAESSTGERSGYATPLHVTTSEDVTPPSPPGNLAAEAISVSSIRLTWTAASDGPGGSGIDHYAVYREGFFYTNISGVNSFTDAGLLQGTTYHYGLEAVDRVGLVSPRVYAEATTAWDDAQAPDAPQNLKAIPVSETEIALSWNPSADNKDASGVSGYQVYRDGAFLVQVAGVSFLDAGLSPLTDYTYQVRALDRAGNMSGFCPPVTARPAIPPNRLIAAHVCESDLWYSRISIVNAGQTAGPVDIHAINADGTELEQVHFESLAPKAAISADLAEIFNPAVFLGGNDIWLMVDSPAEIRGVAVFGTKDGQGATALPLFGLSAPDLVFPYVYIDKDWMTGLTVINVGRELASVSFRAYSLVGDLLSVREIALPVWSKYARLIDQIFPEVADPSSIRFVRADSTQPLIGFEAFGSLVYSGWSGLPCFSASIDFFKEGGPDPLPAGENLFDYPYVAYYNEIPDPSFYFIGITFCNLGSEDAGMKLELYSRSGVLVGEKLIPAVPPFAQVSYDIRLFFDGVVPEGAAYMKVGSTQPVLGFEMYLTNDPATYPYLFEGINIAKTGLSQMCFPVVRHSAEWSTCVKLANPNPLAALVNIRGFGLDGTPKGTVPLAISARGKTEKDLAELFAAPSEVAWLSVTSDRPLIGDIFMLSTDGRCLISYLGLAGPAD